MAIVSFTIQTKTDIFVEGTVGGMWQWWLNDHNDVTVLGPTETDKTTFFANLVVPTTGKATFTAYAVRLDADGNPLGGVVETTFSLGAGDVVIEVAAGLTAEFVPEVNPL